MFSPSRFSKLTILTAAAVFGLAGSASAESFTWAGSGDILTFDIHAQNESTNSLACALVYESLLRWDENLKLEPMLATHWERVPEGFVFEIRKNVHFHEGELLTPADVVYSINRALHPKSQFKSTAAGITGAEELPDGRVLVRTTSGSPVILNQMADLRIMSRSWCEKHGALEPQDYIKKEESYAARHANGTGPFKLKTRQEDVKTVFEINRDWWNEANRRGNVTEATFRPIQSAATRTAALLSGEVDFLIDPAAQDLDRMRKSKGIKVEQGPENRTMMISLDQHRDVSPYIRDADGKPLAKNPFKDPRVREAMFISVNREGIVKGVMRGLAVATGTIVTSVVNGWTPEVSAVPKVDVERAKALLAEAGYPRGFGFTVECPNNRWLNDESTCKAVASQWGRIGLKVTVNSMPRAQFFPKVLTFDSSAGLVGWATPTLDSLYSLMSLSVTFDAKSGNGISNIGRASNARVDELVAAAADEEDAAKRTAMLTEALRVERENFLHIPLHELRIAWAMSEKVHVPMTPQNRLILDWVTIK